MIMLLLLFFLSFTIPISTASSICQESNNIGYNTSIKNIADILKIGVVVNCDRNTSEIIFKIEADSNKWFGIVFSEEMFGDAIIYTTGKNNDKSAMIHDYHMTSNSGSGVHYDQSQDLTQLIQRNAGSGNTYFEYSRPLSNANDRNKDFDFSKGTQITFRCAHGNGMQLNYHQPSGKSDIIVLNLKTGSVTTKTDSKLLLHIIHGIFMWATFAVMIPVNIFVARNRHFWGSSQAKWVWFAVHKVIAAVSIIACVVGFAVVYVAVDESKTTEHVSNYHHYIGIGVLSLLMIHVLIGVLRPHTSNELDTETKQRVIWKKMHRVIAAILFILGNINVAIGIHLKGEIMLVIVHIVWVFVTIVFLLLFEWRRSHHRLYSRSNSIETSQEGIIEDIEMRNDDDYDDDEARMHVSM